MSNVHEFPQRGRKQRSSDDRSSPLFTEDALALRFSEKHKDELRYIATKGSWLKWDGGRWFEEQTHLAFDLARASCRADAQEFGNGNPPYSVYSAKTVAAVERMAKADRRHATTIVQWDAGDYLINTDGATLDLQTTDSYEPRPGDYITKQTTCPCAPPGTTHPQWTAFLNRIAPDPELPAFHNRRE
jgi:putative DNA primase/helicase